MCDVIWKGNLKRLKLESVFLKTFPTFSYSLIAIY